MDTFLLFVVTQYDEDAKAVWSEALLPAVTRINILQDYIVEPTRADFDLKGLQFKKGLDDHLKDAQICLCDITGANPNVMYEIGYAHALNKETIIIRDNGYAIPIDVSDQYIQSYDRTNLKVLSLYLETAISKAVSAVLNKRFATQPEYGITCFRDREVSDLGETIKLASERIDILETNVKTVVATHLDELKKALTDAPALQIRVLTLDPDSSFVNNRAEQLGVPAGHYREELHHAIRTLLDELEPFGERVTLRIYDDFPSQITFIVDDVIFSCSIARAIRSRKLCTFKLHSYDPGAERSFLFHFEAVWGFGHIYVPVRKGEIRST